LRPPNPLHLLASQPKFESAPASYFGSLGFEVINN
jgi:hypothetical protein